MKYYGETIGRWWGYMYSLFGIAVIINGVLVLLVAESPGGIVGAIRRGLGEPSERALFFVLILALSPLFNVYVAIVSAKQAVEADDDYFHFNDEFDLPFLPTAAERKRLIFALSAFTGLVFLPFTVWLYTANIKSLWGLDLPFFMQPGIAVSILTVLAVYFFAPRMLPRAARHLSEIEDSITNRIERGFDEDRE